MPKTATPTRIAIGSLRVAVKTPINIITPTKPVIAPKTMWLGSMREMSNFQSSGTRDQKP